MQLGCGAHFPSPSTCRKSQAQRRRESVGWVSRKETGEYQESPPTNTTSLVSSISKLLGHGSGQRWDPLSSHRAFCVLLTKVSSSSVETNTSQTMTVLKDLRNDSSKMSELPGGHGVRSDSDSTTLVLRKENHVPAPLGV